MSMALSGRARALLFYGSETGLMGRLLADAYRRGICGGVIVWGFPRR